MDAPSRAQIASEAVVAAYASKVMYTGSWITVAASFISERAAILGLLLGLAGFITNLVFSYRRDKREARKTQAYMETMAHKPSDTE